MDKFIKIFLIFSGIFLFGVNIFIAPFIVSGQSGSPPGPDGEVLYRVAGALYINADSITTPTGSNSNLIFSPAGNVGIQTTPTTEKLEVGGNVKATTFIGNWSGILSAANISSGVFGSGAGGGNYAFPSAVRIGYSSIGGFPAGTQFQINYDATYFASFAVDSKGQLTIAPSGNATTTISSALNISRALTFGGIAEPNKSPAGQGRIYFDTIANKFKVSENGGNFVNLVDIYLINGGNFLYTSSTSWNVSIGTSTQSTTAKLQVSNTNDLILKLARLNASSYREVASTSLRIREADDSFVIQNNGVDSLILRDNRLSIGGQSLTLANLSVYRTSNNDTISALSGSLDSFTTLSIGRISPEFRLSIVDTAGRPALDPPTSAYNNDARFQLLDSTRRIHFALGGGSATPPILSLGATGVGIGYYDFGLLPNIKLIVNGPMNLRALSDLNFVETMTVPNGSMYYDSETNKFRCYQDGAWTNCIGSGGGGISGSGASGQVTFWNGGTSVTGDNSLYWNNTDKTLGVGTISTDPNYKITTNIGGIKAESTNQPAGYFDSSSGYGLLVNRGNVGIGTLSPEYALQVNKNNSGLFLSTAQHDAGATSIFFGGNGHINDTWMRLNYNGANFSLGIDRNTGSDGGGVPVWGNLMTIEYGGNVGIGISNPTTKLEVNGTAKVTTIQTNSFYMATGAVAGKILTATGVSGQGTWQDPPVAGTNYWAQGNNYLYPVGGNSTKMRIGTYQNFDFDADSNNMGFYWNAYWDGATTNYKYINTSAWNGRAARLVGDSDGLRYEQASGGTDPISWNKRLTIDVNGDLILGNQKNIIFQTDNSNFHPGEIKFKGYAGLLKGRIYSWPTAQPTDNVGVFIRTSGVSPVDPPEFGVYAGGKVGIGMGWTEPTKALEVNGEIGATSISANTITVQGSNVCRADGIGCPSSQLTARTQCPPRRVVIKYIDVAGEVEYLIHNGCEVNFGYVILSDVAVYKGDTLKGYVREGTESTACSEFGFGSAFAGKVLS